MSSDTLVVNPNNGLRSPFAAVEPPLWAGLIASYLDADILDAEGPDFTLDQTERMIRFRNPKKVIIVVMGNNPSVSSSPKMQVAEALADRLQDLKVSLTGIHPIAAGSKYPVIKTPFEGFPMMPWDKLPMQRYRAHNWHCLDGSPRAPYASIYTSLGCPFDCYYCNIHTLYRDRHVQLRPVKDIVREVDTLNFRYKVRNVKIWDELFTLNEDRLLEICRQLEDYDLNVWAYGRLDTVTEIMLKAMKQAGINWLAYGFESVRDRKMTGSVGEVIKMTRDAGINIIANFMFGLPGTTREDDEASLDFAKKNLFEWVNFYDAKPYPGSRWWQETGNFTGTFDQYQDISPFRQKAFTDYFTNPDYVKMIAKKFGNQAVEHIAEMVNFQLPERSGWVNSLIRC